MERSKNNKSNMTRGKAILVIIIWVIIYIDLIWSYAGNYIHYYINKNEYTICQVQIKRIAPTRSGHVYFDYEWNNKKCEGIDSASVTDYEGKQINIAIHKITGESFRTELVFDVLFVAVAFCTFITASCLLSVVYSICCKIKQY